MYLTASRSDIMHATCYCARYQTKPTKKHLIAVKRIFRYLKDTINMGLWYPKDNGFELTAFSDSDHAGCLDSRKSTSGGIQFLGGDKTEYQLADMFTKALPEDRFKYLDRRIVLRYDGDECDKDRMPNKIELALEQSQQGVSNDVLETMTTVNQGTSVEEIERVIAQRLANAIEAIAIYETKTNLAHKSMSQTERQEEEVPRAHTAWPINKNAYDRSLPLYYQCKSHHSGPCTVKYGNCKKVGHIIQNFGTPATAKNQGTRTCYECGSLGHYKSKCLIVKFHEHVDMIHGKMRASKRKTMQDAIEIATKLRNKKISTLVECWTKNKKRLDNTSKNNQNQQKPNKRQNTGRAYTARHGEKKHYSGSKLLCSKCNYHYDGPCAPKCHQCNRFVHLARDCRSSTNANTTNIQNDTGAGQEDTCYECGNQGHYRRDCPERKNQNQENQIKSTKARRVVHAFGGGKTKQDLNNIEDEIEA
nr:uncharacterized mitochondrial protein AtMg00810-like [Tanacetum cinerariifolium]